MDYRENTTVTVMALLLCGACATAEGTKPHDMSTAQHEAAAKQEEGAAVQHGEQYDPAAAVQSTTCTRGSICWTSTKNPTAQHKADEAQHGELAEKHRAAAQSLRDAEAAKCVGISESDRDVSPFYHREDITSVSEVMKPMPQARSEMPMLRGGRVVFRAVPGLTAEWFQRVIDCHLARAAAAGNEMPEMAYCPLTIRNVHAMVSSTGDGFAVEVTADDDATAKQIWTRVQALAPGHSG